MLVSANLGGEGGGEGEVHVWEGVDMGRQGKTKLAANR